MNKPIEFNRYYKWHEYLESLDIKVRIYAKTLEANSLSAYDISTDKLIGCFYFYTNKGWVMLP